MDLDPFACWMLIRLGHAEPVAPGPLAHRLGTSMQRLQPALDELQQQGCIDLVDGAVSLTPAGRDAYARLVEVRGRGLEKLLRGWAPEQRAEMASTVRALAERFLSDDFGDLLAASRARLQAAARGS